jgi:hypothetical protein
MVDESNYITIYDHTVEETYCTLERSRVENEKPTGEVNLDRHYYKSNLLAKNWFYGTTNETAYKLELFKKTTQFNLTSCPR